MLKRNKFALEIFLLIYASYLISPICCVPPSPRPIPVTYADVEDEGTTVIPTDIPQKFIDQALNMDYGTYTTVSHHYERHQWMNLNPIDMCYDQYSKCITGLVHPNPVCLLFMEQHRAGYKPVRSYCEGYLENCRMKIRYWRIMAYGRCFFRNDYWYLYHDWG